MKVVLSAAFSLLFLLGPTADAHTRSQSFSTWTQKAGELRVTFSVASLQATRLGALDPRRGTLGELLARHLRDRLGARAGGEACSPIGVPTPLAARKGFERVEWRFECERTEPLELEVSAFFEAAPSHVHYARVRTESGPRQELLFTDSQRIHAIQLGAEDSSSRHIDFRSYVLLGIEHILVGFDHIAFLLALLLLCRRLREVVFMVTGFTLGHSLTLSLAVLGLVDPNPRVIEALIGFTIALVAAENVGVGSGASRAIARIGAVALAVMLIASLTVDVGLPVLTWAGLALFTACYLPLSDTRERAARMRPVVTVLFGLIHGFGFASVLMEIGLEPGRLAVGLLGFNLGVEIGQLGLVALLGGLAWPFVARIDAGTSRLAVDALSAGLCALGVYWFVGRAFSG